MDLRKDDREWRTVKLYGQEVNLLTSAIAKMNMGCCSGIGKKSSARA